MGQGLLFQIRGVEGARAARFALVDMRGQTVWSRNVPAHGLTQVAWDGATNTGRGTSQGVYIVRVVMVDGANKPVRVFEKKVPLTR
jgi:hypothetical protein